MVFINNIPFTASFNKLAGLLRTEHE